MPSSKPTPASKPKKAQRLDKTIDAIQGRYTERALQRGREMHVAHPPALVSSFPQLDALTGCDGIPLNHTTLLSGRDITSGRLTLAYKILAGAQTPQSGESRATPSRAAQSRAAQSRRKQLVVVMDLCRMANADYMARCGIDLEHAVITRPESAHDAINLLVDIVRSKRVRAVLVNTLPDLAGEARSLDAGLAVLKQILPRSNCAVIFVDDPQPLWQRWLPVFDRSAIRQTAALHLELRNEQWLDYGDDAHLRGYRSRVEVIRSHWARSGQHTNIEILFNGTVKAGPVW